MKRFFVWHSKKLPAKTFASFIQRKYVQPENLSSFCEELKKKGKRIVSLNGSFDLLHPGHLEMIYQASKQGDVLFLLLNTDASIQSYKGPDRPICPLEVRLQHVAALEMVDFVSWFSEENPIAILDKVRPHVHVNGSEYGENCIEADIVKKHGGSLHIVQLVEGYSSTYILQKIRDCL